jgi:protein TonB
MPDFTRFVRAGRAGDAGGGGGGGNRSTSRPARGQTRPADALAVAVTAPPPTASPDRQPQVTPDPPPALAIAAQPMDAGQFRQIGMLDEPYAPATTARGGGDGGGTDTGRGPGSGPGAGPGYGPGVDGGVDGGVYRGGGDVTGPRIIHQTPPQYSAEAMRAKIHGVAILGGVVGADGTLRDLRIVRSLDDTFGLDQEALRCVRQWRFRPGTRLGQPVPVYVTIEVAFNLR